MADSNLFAYFRKAFSRNADKVVLMTDDDRALTFVDVEHLSGQFAQYLWRLGVRPGDRISVQVMKSPESLCLYLACLRGGFVYHPLNIGYKKSELEYFIGDADPVVIVCDRKNECDLRAVAKNAGVSRVLTLGGDGSGSLMTASCEIPDEFQDMVRKHDDLAALLYSSGTTGTPKGIMLTHGNLLSNAQALVEAWGFTASDRLLHALPIFHVHGLFVATGCVLLSGASMRWLSGFDVGKVISYLPECTVMMGVPTFYTRLLAEPSFSSEVCRKIRLFISGSAPLLVETFVEFEERSGHRILERYGLSETNMNTSNPLKGERKAGTVGLPLPGIEVRVVDEDGNLLPRNSAGKLQVKGPNVFAGYWCMPEKTADEFTGDGFFDTGDIGLIDDDGYVSIVGRAKDLVITGGLNVYPKEIEMLIDGLPGVAESAVIGVPHADFGEGVVAVVVRQPKSTATESMIVEACRHGLAEFKVPKRVIFVDELPRNTMSKVQKSLLREQYTDLLYREGR